MALAQPHFDRVNKEKREQRTKTLLIIASLIVGLIAIGAVEKTADERKKRVSAENQIEKAKSEGRQEILELMEKEGELVQMKNGDWYWAVKGEFTNY